jgi:hypothetical protein
MAEKPSPGTRQTDSKNLVWFGEIERKLAKISMPTFTYHSSSYLSYVCTEGVLEAAGHTNTMMWIGRMEDCPIDLSSQVRLIK